MLCKSPYMAGTRPFGCGQCLPCRIGKGRQWKWRQVLESLTHAENCFVTLTYSDSELPPSGELNPRDLQLFLKKLRKRVSPHRFRYFAVGEYGDESWRPHFHLSVFGLSGRTDVLGGDRVRHYGISEAVARSWNKGFSLVAEFSDATAGYVCGYTVKRLNRGHYALQERGLSQPEFIRMSNRPGIGTEAMRQVASDLACRAIDWASGDVPRELRIGQRKVPLSRYMLRKLREFSGFSDAYIREVKDNASMEQSIEMLGVRSRHADAFTFKEAYAKEVHGKITSLEARSKIFTAKRKI